MPANQFLIAHHAIGHAMTIATKTSFIKSFESKDTTPPTEAPNAFRMPISFVRCSAVNAVKPKRPRQEIKMASRANEYDSLPTVSSLLYNLENSRSENW